MKKALSAFVIFLGSALAFAIEPLVGNTLLPVFGGTAAVWTVCLASFQTLMLAGYFYADLLGRRHSTGRIFLHILLLFAAAGLTWIASSHRGALMAVFSEIMWPAVGALAATFSLCAFSFVLLSANSSLVQVISGGEYRLYAISNFGSFAGLLSYPLILEPCLELGEQWRLFGIGLVGYAIMLGLLALTARPACACTGAAQDNSDERFSEIFVRHREVFLLSALSCFLLNSVTVHLCNDLTPLPFMWAIVLSLYLFSYMAAFTNRGGRIGRWIHVAVLPLCLAGIAFSGSYLGRHFVAQLTLSFSVVFLGGWMVHARMYRLKPERDGLTGYYLALAAGGAVGGVLASIAVPHIFSFIAEYPISLALLAGVAAFEGLEILSLRIRAIGGLTPAIRKWIWWGMVALTLVGWYFASRSTAGVLIARIRNFYGVDQVELVTHRLLDGRSYQVHKFSNGGTAHGFQPVNNGWKRRIGTAYYEEHSGGLAILAHPKRKAKRQLRVALAGMGIGTLAAFCERGDLFRFYEINPHVISIATNTNLFTYISAAPGTVEIIEGDVRKALERERKNAEPRWDVIVSDVFSGDAIPPHTVTEEAFRLYLDRLEEDGILAFHLTNWHLDLWPIMKAAAKRFNLSLECLECPIKTPYGFDAKWAFLTRKPIDFFNPKFHRRIAPESIRDLPLITDEKHPLMPYLAF